MSLAISANGHRLSTTDYITAQTVLMGQFSAAAIRTGPEQDQISGEVWKALDRAAHVGMADKESWVVLSQNEHVSYLMRQWMLQYSAVFGALAGRANMPVEVVEAAIENHQYAVVEHLSQLRYLWHKAVGSSLPLQSSVGQVRWDGPTVVDIHDGEDTPYVRHAALFPHVIDQGNGSVDLRFATKSIAPEVLMVAIQDDVRESVQRELVRYS